nr:ABC transporter permease [Saccharofermentans sp.]
LKEGVGNGEFRIKNRNELLKINPAATVTGYSIDNVESSRTFIGLILAVSFLVITSLVVAAVAMMLANCISNYIRENMKTLGALKAIGYTGKDIKSSLLIWFTLIAVLASIAGIAGTYLSMPVFAGIVIGQIGLPYQVSFNLLATVIPVAFIILFTAIVAAACSSKISWILPIVALREGIESHNFKKNHIALDKTSLGLNTSLAMKTFFGNMKQNVITFFVVGFMVFSCIISLLMYENFNRHPKIDILATESCAGVVAFDKETAEEGLKYLESRSDVKNIREILTMNFYYDDKESLFTYVVDDSSKMNNRNLCYTGRLPQYDNEIAVSGAFAKVYGFSVGDEIQIDFGEKSFKYLITGFIQTTNNEGREAILTIDAAAHLVDMENIPGWYWFDLTEETDDSSVTIRNIETVLDECKEKYGEHVINTMNFIEMIEGSMTTFKSISTLMLIVMITISVVVIALILFLLIKSLVYHKRKDYGIYKALGYTSVSLMLQTALSFMPAVIASIIVFSIGSYYGANPYMSTFMRAFGLVKCTFSIPVTGVVIIGVGLAAVSFALALLQTRRIRKIEAYNMLVAE